MSTDILNPKTHDLAHVARLGEENLALVARLTRLRTALEEAARENAELRREVARLRAENEHLRGTSTVTQSVARARYGDRAARIRVMLRDQHSRNP
jgi:cell division protein FtsB